MPLIVIDCPFTCSFSFNCVYYDLGYCKDIEISPRNGDAWCYTMIEKGIALEKILQRPSE